MGVAAVDLMGKGGEPLPARVLNLVGVGGMMRQRRKCKTASKWGTTVIVSLFAAALLVVASPAGASSLASDEHRLSIPDHMVVFIMKGLGNRLMLSTSVWVENWQTKYPPSNPSILVPSNITTTVRRHGQVVASHTGFTYRPDGVEKVARYDGMWGGSFGPGRYEIELVVPYEVKEASTGQVLASDVYRQTFARRIPSLRFQEPRRVTRITTPWCTYKQSNLTGEYVYSVYADFRVTGGSSWTLDGPRDAFYRLTPEGAWENPHWPRRQFSFGRSKLPSPTTLLRRFTYFTLKGREKTFVLAHPLKVMADPYDCYQSG